MNIFGLALPRWANDIIDVVGRKLARAVKAEEKKEEAADALRADALKDDDGFAEEAAAREVATGEKRPK